MPGAHASANLQARHTRQHPIENDEIRRVFDEPDIRLVAAFDAFDDEAFGFEVVGQKDAQRLFVLDDENAGRRAAGPRRPTALGLKVGLAHQAGCGTLEKDRPLGLSIGKASPVTR